MSSLGSVQLEQSSSVIRSVKYHLKHECVVHDFSLFSISPDEPKFPHLQSVVFYPSQDKRLQFYILIFPKGDREESKKFFAVFLQAAFTEELTVTVKFKVSIAGSQYKKEVTNVFKQKTGLGWNEFAEHQHLLNSAHVLADDKLTVTVELEIVAKRDSESLISIQDDIKSLAIEKNLAIFEALLESGELSDVVLIVDGKSIQAHKKNILAAQSSVFKAMFQADMKEKNEGKVIIDDIKIAAFEEMLRFMYTGKVEEIEKNAEELLGAADKYDLASLKNICEMILCDKMASSTVAQLLYIVDLHGATKLKASCLDFIRLHIFEVMLTKEWSKVAILLGEEMCLLEANKDQQTEQMKKGTSRYIGNAYARRRSEYTKNAPNLWSPSCWQ